MKPFSQYFLFNFFVLILFTCKLSFCQKPVIGIKAGIVFSDATIQTAMPDDPYQPNYGGRTGVTGGVFVDIPVGKKWILRTGSEIVGKGVREAGNYSLPFSSIDFPLNFIYKSENAKGHLMMGTGPVICVPLNNQYSGYPRQTEIGLNGLVGYEFPIGASLNLNYCFGLTNASNHNQYISKISNRYFGITAGYTF